MKSSPVLMCGLKGCISLFLNTLTAFSTDSAMSNAIPNISVTFLSVTNRPGGIQNHACT